MKIAFIIQDLFHQGAQYVTALMVRGFIAKGYKVDLILSKVHTDLLALDNIPFEIPDSTNVIILKDRKASKNVKEIRQYLKHTDAEAIISMSSNYTISIALASIGLRNKPKLAYVEHSGIIGLNRYSLREEKTPSLFSSQGIKSKLIKRQFNIIMAVSHGTAIGVERMNRLQKGTVKVVYNPVIDDNFYEKLSKSPEHPWLVDKKMPTFIAAGAHSKIKDHITLFEAFKLVNQTTAARLILFGKGDLTTEYKKWIDENNLSNSIDLASHTSQLPAEMKASDGFIVSSTLESFSLVIVEALAAKVPVISTDCLYGPAEILKKGKYGTLVPISDAKAMAEAIVNQITNPKAPAPKESWERFTLGNIVNNYERAMNINDSK